MPPLPNLIAIALFVLIFVAAFGPRALRFVASRRGRLGVAVVKSSERTSVRDELKRFEHRLVLDVTVPGEAPFEATVNQVLTFMIVGSPAVGSRLQVRVLGSSLSVYVVGPIQ